MTCERNKRKITLVGQTTDRLGEREMTRKHFRAIADCLKNTNASAQTCEAFAIYLKTENPRFDITKFLNACGVNAYEVSA